MEKNISIKIKELQGKKKYEEQRSIPLPRIRIRSIASDKIKRQMLGLSYEILVKITDIIYKKVKEMSTKEQEDFFNSDSKISFYLPARDDGSFDIEGEASAKEFYNLNIIVERQRKIIEKIDKEIKKLQEQHIEEVNIDEEKE